MYTLSKKTFAICAVAIFTASIVLGQASSTITANDPRALAQALLQLEGQIGIAINYEDPPYSYAGDISDVTNVVMTPAQQAAHPGAHILVPRGGQISINLAQVPGVGQQPLSALPSLGSASPLVNALVAQNVSQGLPGVYTATSSGGAFYVVPGQVRSVSGSMTSVAPVLDTPVTIPYPGLPPGEALDAVLQQVSQVSGVKVGLGSAPLNLLLSSHVTTSATNGTARSVLGQILVALASRQMPDGSVASLMTYHLYYDPGLKYYLLNVHRVSGPQLNGPASTPVAVTPNAVSSPFAKKK